MRNGMKLRGTGMVQKVEENAYERDHLLSIEEVGKLLGKKPQTIRNYVAKRQIPFVPTCPVTFLERSIWAWLKKQEVQTWR